MTTVTDSAFNFLCSHDNDDNIRIIYCAGFADLNHGDFNHY